MVDTRASDADREAAVSLLREAALEGRLDHDELEQRVAGAYGASYRSELVALTGDVIEPLEFLRPGSRVNRLALVSVVSALLWVFWVGSVTAVVSGHVALWQIARSHGTQTGRVPALLGLMFGYFGLAALLFVLLF